jgi:head-tail adaptor
MRFNPGSLREQITISRATVTDDGMGGETTANSVIFSGFASVIAKASKDGIVSGRDVEVRTHEVTIRLEIEPKQDDLITWRSQSLRVKAVRPDYATKLCVMDCVLEA